MSDKTFQVVFRNGEIWALDAEAIAEVRAQYYANKDKDTSFEAERKMAMDDTYEIVDWATGNMRWDDLCELGLKRTLGPQNIDYAKEYARQHADVKVVYERPAGATND